MYENMTLGETGVICKRHGISEESSTFDVAEALLKLEAASEADRTWMRKAYAVFKAMIDDGFIVDHKPFMDSAPEWLKNAEVPETPLRLQGLRKW